MQTVSISNENSFLNFNSVVDIVIFKGNGKLSIQKWRISIGMVSGDDTYVNIDGLEIDEWIERLLGNKFLVPAHAADELKDHPEYVLATKEPTPQYVAKLIKEVLEKRLPNVKEISIDITYE
jgi:hypothetical protein